MIAILENGLDVSQVTIQRFGADEYEAGLLQGGQGSQVKLCWTGVDRGAVLAGKPVALGAGILSKNRYYGVSATRPDAVSNQQSAPSNTATVSGLP